MIQSNEGVRLRSHAQQRCTVDKIFQSLKQLLVLRCSHSTRHTQHNTTAFIHFFFLPFSPIVAGIDFFDCLPRQACFGRRSPKLFGNGQGLFHKIARVDTILQERSFSAMVVTHGRSKGLGCGGGHHGKCCSCEKNNLHVVGRWVKFIPWYFVVENGCRWRLSWSENL